MGIKEPNIIKRQERNERIRNYAKAHPGMTKKAIARIFKISHTMIGRILKEGNLEVKVT